MKTGCQVVVIVVCILVDGLKEVSRRIEIAGELLWGIEQWMVL